MDMAVRTYPATTSSTTTTLGKRRMLPRGSSVTGRGPNFLKRRWWTAGYGRSSSSAYDVSCLIGEQSGRGGCVRLGIPERRASSFAWRSPLTRETCGRGSNRRSLSWGRVSGVEERVRTAVRELTALPPLRLVKRMKGSTLALIERSGGTMRREMAGGVERPASYYDSLYSDTPSYGRKYWESKYYAVWLVIADRISRSGLRVVVDVGCGPGQFAGLLRDKGIHAYTGIDFSQYAIEIARNVCPEYTFVAVDITSENSLQEVESSYDCVLMLEFLEHIESDVEVLARVVSGTRLLLTVPSFPDPAHVRYFDSAAAVKERYSPLLSAILVDECRLGEDGNILFLVDGIRR